MRSRLLDYDPVTKVKRMFHPSSDGNTFIEHGEQEISERLSINKALQNMPRDGWGEGQRVASVPAVVVEYLMREGIYYDQKRLKAWLNDPDNLAFRTRLGKV